MTVTNEAPAQPALEDHPIFRAPIEVPVELERRAEERGWPDGMLRRALELRVPNADIELWLSHPKMAPQEVAWQLDNLARVFGGALRVREATWRDWEALADLYATSPEKVDDWDLVVERGPNPYAQFRLQEHANLQVIECRGILLGAAAHATRNTFIGGERLTVHVMSAWRVRDGFRGYGLSRLLQTAPGPGTAWFGAVTYWYERVGNASKGWLDKMRTMAETQRDNRVDGLSATVHLFAPDATAATGPDRGLRTRPVRRDDIPRCIELINATHEGLDLFRPYTPEFLETHLDDPMWGPKPGFWATVFTWDDYWVVEDTSGAVVACGGLWDRGRDLREVWSHRESGERRTVDATALLDWGHAPDRADAMAFLVRGFLRQTAELGRSHLLAPLEHAPDVLDELVAFEPVIDTRALHCMGFNDGTVRVEPSITRPYTDLAYW
jgi:hypothetical protein